MSALPIELMTIADIRAMQPPEYLIHGLLPEHGLTTVCGPPKCGKSLTALDWALSIAAGVPWFGHAVKQGPVVYIYAETPAGLRLRVPAWCSVRVNDKDPQDFFVYPSRVKIANINQRNDLIALIEARGINPALIVVDTLAKCYSGASENDATAMGEFVEACDKLGDHFKCAVLVVHHTARDTAHARGSTALEGGVNAEFQMKKLPNGKVRFTNSHQRDGEAHSEMWFRFNPSGDSVVLALTGKGDAGEGGKAKAPTAKDNVKQALGEFMPDGATPEQWYKAAMTKGVAHRNFYTQRKALLDDGEVNQEGGRVFLAPADLRDVSQMRREDIAA